ncbi:hypothetical protein GCM10017776_55380 [Streptomyces griseoluteus]|nr:hypothetical protein GCM10017776_55380 [Streptomyces griseoluteus]
MCLRKAPFRLGGLDEPHAARNSQDASSQRSESEAWIDGEEGRIILRRGQRAEGVEDEGVEKNEGLRNRDWTSVCQVATLTLCAAC